MESEAAFKSCLLKDEVIRSHKKKGTISEKCDVIVPKRVLSGSWNAHKFLQKLLLEKFQFEKIVPISSVSSSPMQESQLK
jgi:hypothetical protein